MKWFFIFATMISALCLTPQLVAAQIDVSSEAIVDIDWHPLGIMFAYVQADGTVHVIDSTSDDIIFSFSPPAEFEPRRYEEVTWSHSGEQLAAGVGEKIYIWNTNTWALVDEFLSGSPDGISVTEFSTEPEGVVVLEWSPDDSMIAILSTSVRMTVRNENSKSNLWSRIISNVPWNYTWVANGAISSIRRSDY